MKKIIIIFLLLLFTSCTTNQTTMKESEKQDNTKPMFKNIRQPAVAGQFYLGEANSLKEQINKYLAEAETEKIDGQIKAIMVPHAGYDYSAPVAAYSYKQLEGRQINTAIIISNSHSAYFNGVAVDESDAWQTPLGTVAVDKDLAAKIVQVDEAISFNSKVHANDHTLEVQLPFLQIVIDGNFKIVPILFGNTKDDSYQKLAKALADNLGKNDIVIISTDMSHYPSHEDANRIDQKTLEMIKTADVAKLESHITDIEIQNVPEEQTVICGVDGVKTVMEIYNLLGWDEIRILKYANSGDVAIGDKSSVVGYGAVAFTSPPAHLLSKERGAKEEGVEINLLNKEQQKELLHIAKITVENYVKDKKTPEFTVSDERLQRKEGAFVTLHKDGQLRGCIGQIVPSEKPLWQVVRDMAMVACSEDYRFNPVSEKELDKIDYEVSVLSVPASIDNWQNVELGKHGVIVRKGLRGGVFLPQVAAETGWTREEFLGQLCSQKAGLPSDCYKDKDINLEVFTAQVFSENDIE